MTLRRLSVCSCLLWLVLAALPLRALASVTMHLAASADHTAAAACHHGNASEADASAPASSPCSLCDLCHGAPMPSTVTLAHVQRVSASRVPVERPLIPEGPTARLERPPKV